jgi:hypothetical protein
MGAPKPCLGYPSRTQAVVALRKQGLTTAEIAERTGIDLRDVSALETSAMRSKMRGSPQAVSTGVMLPPWLLDALKPHAEKRCIKPGVLAFRIVETVVKEGLIDSVMDDLDEAAAA